LHLKKETQEINPGFSLETNKQSKQPIKAL